MTSTLCFAIPLTVKHRFVKLVTCDYCGQVSLLHDMDLDPTGHTAMLTDLPSLLCVDVTGQLQGRRSQVMGRLRYQYESGFWG